MARPETSVTEAAPARRSPAEDLPPGGLRIALLSALLVLTALAVTATYWPVLSAQALAFDDGYYLTNNPLVQNPSWTSTCRFLGEVLRPSTVVGYYQPLTMISLMLDYAVAGQSDNLRPFHQTSLALHIANTLLVIVLLYVLFRQTWTAVMVGLLFGVHPMTVEPIAWIGERKTVLATFFSLWSLLLYLRYVRTERWPWYGLSGVVFVLALLSKPTSTPLPLVMLLLDFWPLGRLTVHPKTRVAPASRRCDFRVFGCTLSRRVVVEKIPFLLIAGAFAIVAVVSQRHLELSVIQSFSAGQTFLLICHNLIFYPWHMIRPVHLSSIYPFPENISLSNGMLLTGVIVNAAMLVLLPISLRWTRALLAGWLCYFILLSPTLLNKGYSPSVAWDKYAYLPSVGLLMILAWSLGKLWSRLPTPAAKAGVCVLPAVALAAALSSATQRYLTHWRDTESLFSRMLTLAPRSAVLHDAVGFALFQQGEVDQAIGHYTEAIGLDPRLPSPHNNLAQALMRKKRYDEAAQHCFEALGLQPNCPEALNNLGVARINQGRTDDAIKYYKEAIRARPEYPLAHCNLAAALVSKGRIAEAADHYRLALQLNPRMVQAHINLGLLLVQEGKLDEAIPCFATAVQLQPDNPDAHYFLGLATLQKGRPAESVPHFREVLRLKPDDVNARRLLDMALSPSSNVVTTRPR